MRTYLLNLYYPNLADYATTISNIKDDVVKISGANWRVIKAGQQICSIAFSTTPDPTNFEEIFNDYGQDQFQYLLIEVSGIHAGWTDKSVYQWLRGRLARD